jgi:sugar fermentation stimulation protein A
VKTGPHTRLDLALEGDGGPNCYIEIKNCTLVENGRAFFPDAVTDRGRKHLEELIHLVENGSRGVIFFLIQRMDAGVFSPADHIDPEYGRVLRKAVKAGVEAMAYDVTIDPERIDLNRSIEVNLKKG